MADDKQSDGANLNSGGDANIGGDVIGRDNITTTSTSTTTNIEGGPVARYAVIGIIIAVVSMAAIAIIVLVLSRGTPSLTAPSEATPTPSTTATGSPSATPVLSATPAPTLASTPTPPFPTALPSNTPDPRLRLDCIVDKEWTYIPFDVHSDNCLKLESIFAQDGGLLLQPSTQQGENKQRGIYTPLAGDVEITLTVVVNSFSVSSSELRGGSNMVIAITRLEPKFSFEGVLLYYYGSLSSDAFGTARVQLMDEIGFDQKSLGISPLPYGEDQHLKLSLRANALAISGDHLETKSIILPSGRRALYIGYNLKDESQLNASLSNLTIQPTK
jgi:hypothetical protein